MTRSAAIISDASQLSCKAFSPSVPRWSSRGRPKMFPVLMPDGAEQSAVTTARIAVLRARIQPEAGRPCSLKCRCAFGSAVEDRASHQRAVRSVGHGSPRRPRATAFAATEKMSANILKGPHSPSSHYSEQRRLTLAWRASASPTRQLRAACEFRVQRSRDWLPVNGASRLGNNFGACTDGPSRR